MALNTNNPKPTNSHVPQFTYIYYGNIDIDNLHLFVKCITKGTRLNCARPKKKYMCVYCHMSKKSRVGRSGFFFLLLLSAKLEIVVPGSGIRKFGISFSKFPVSCHLLKLFYDELCSFSTFFALNFDKKLAVE